MAKIDPNWKADSDLVTYVKWSPNYTAKRKMKIDTIIIHCMAGNLTVERCGELFANPKRGASSTYGVGSDGKIAQYVKECYRPWTTGGDKVCNGWTGSDYDHRSITIEVANNTLAPNWGITPEALQGTVAIVTDICRRHNIKPIWKGDPKLVGNANAQSFALHKWFATKACPGPTIISLMPYIAMTAEKNLNNNGYYINGFDYSPVFNPEYYANRYADLRAAFGHDANLLWLHFQQFGMNELRRGSEEFDPIHYRDHNPDVAQAYKGDNPMYYFHYVAFGKEEGRKGHES